MEIVISAFKANRIRKLIPTGYHSLAKSTHKINHHKNLQVILDIFNSHYISDSPLAPLLEYILPLITYHIHHYQSYHHLSPKFSE